MIDVPEIQFDFVFVCQAASAHDLSPAGKSGFDIASSSLMIGPFFVLPGQEWPGTDKGHVAFEYIDQLGQFVDAEFTKETTDVRDAWIAIVAGRKAIGIDVGSHGSEFIERKNLSFQSNAILPEDGWAGRFYSD